jgi:hypothetical protein
MTRRVLAGAVLLRLVTVAAPDQGVTTRPLALVGGTLYPSPTESAIHDAAAAGEAHRRGKPAFVHPSSREGLMAAVRGGADVIVHTGPKRAAGARRSWRRCEPRRYR